MVVSNLKQFKVNSYNELYAMYLDGELGVIEQRMGVIPKWVVGKDGTDKELIIRLLEKDTDNLYQISWLDYGVKSYFVITIIGIGFVKNFSEPVSTYDLQFGEDGVFETIYQIDDPTASRDGSSIGDLEYYGTSENI